MSQCIFIITPWTVENNMKNILLGEILRGVVRCLPTFRNNVSVSFSRVKIRCTETSVNSYHTAPRNNPEERRSHQHRGGSIKSRLIHLGGFQVQLWKQWLRRNTAWDWFRLYDHPNNTECILQIMYKSWISHLINFRNHPVISSLWSQNLSFHVHNLPTISRFMSRKLT